MASRQEGGPPGETGVVLRDPEAFLNQSVHLLAQWHERLQSLAAQSAEDAARLRPGGAGPSASQMWKLHRTAGRRAQPAEVLNLL